MKVGVAVFRNIVAPRLDFSEQIFSYDIENGKVLNMNAINLVLGYPMELLNVLRSEGIDTIICGGGPRGFLRNLYFNGINILNGGFMEPQKAVELFLEQKLLPFFTEYDLNFGWGRRNRWGRGAGRGKKNFGRRRK